MKIYGWPWKFTGLKLSQSEECAVSRAEPKNLFCSEFCVGGLELQSDSRCSSVFHFPQNPALYSQVWRSTAEKTIHEPLKKCRALHFCNQAPTERKPLLLQRASCGGKRTKKRQHNSQKSDKDQARTQKNKTGRASQGQWAQRNWAKSSLQTHLSQISSTQRTF